MNEDQLVAFGGAIKALGDGKVGGYLVKFTDASTPDLTGEYFDRATDYDLEPGDTARIYYNHGLDPVLKKRKLGSGTMRVDDVGVWIEAQLALRDDYERAIYAMVEAERLGWSSGTLPNLVEYEPVGKARYIKSWPLGKDASLTPTPAAGLIATAVQPLKTWAEATKGMGVTPAVKAIDLGQRIDLIHLAVDVRFNGMNNREMVTAVEPGQYSYCEYVYEDFIIVRRGVLRWSVPYTLSDTAGTVTLGDATPVEMDWIPVKGMLATMLSGKPVIIQASSTEAEAPEVARSATAPVDAAVKLGIELSLLEVEL